MGTQAKNTKAWFESLDTGILNLTKKKLLIDEVAVEG